MHEHVLVQQAYAPEESMPEDLLDQQAFDLRMARIAEAMALDDLVEAEMAEAIDPG